MIWQIQSPDNDNDQSNRTTSRRRVIRSFSLVIVGLLSGSRIGQAQTTQPLTDESEIPQSNPIQSSRRPSKRPPRNIDDMQIFMQNRMKEMELRRLEETKEQLGLSDIEWSLVKPRFLKVTMQQKEVSGVVDRPGLSIGPGQLHANLDTPTGNAVYDAKQQLRNLANDETASSDDIKKQINALRKAQETAQQKLSVARQELRSLLTVRQEAYLITTGVLD